MPIEQSLLVATNEQVISCVEDSIQHNYTDLSKRDLATFLYGWYMLRTKQHVKYVIAAGCYLKPAFEKNGFGSFFDGFISDLSMHDNDKFANTVSYIAANIICSSLCDPNIKPLFEPTQWIRYHYEDKVQPEHVRKNNHHPESWASIPRNGRGRPLMGCDGALFPILFDEGYFGNCGAHELPVEERYNGFRKLAEMVADWSAMGIEFGNTAIEWYDKTNGDRWEFSGLTMLYLESLLEASKEVFKYHYENELKGLRYPNYVKPEEPKIEIQGVESCGCEVTECSAEKYEAPWDVETLKKKGLERLLKSPWHLWRAETGIELIHKEPSITEFFRIWKNWQQMTPDMKKKSDAKSKELFGMTNEEHFKALLKEYNEEASKEDIHGSVESFNEYSTYSINDVIPEFSKDNVGHEAGKYIFRWVEQTKDNLEIEDIDPTNLNKALIEKFFAKEEECSYLLDWLTVPNYDLLPNLVGFGRYIDEQYGFKKPITVYRGIRSGITFKHKQETMGLIDNTTLDNTIKEFARRGYKFSFNPTGPMSVARSPWIAKVYGNVISKCLLPPDHDKLVITAELAYVLQRLQKEKYPDKRAINMSCMMEIVVFPGKATNWEVVTTTGDISSELPQLMTSEYLGDYAKGDRFFDGNPNEVVEQPSSEVFKPMIRTKLTTNDDLLMKDKRYVRFLFMTKYVCKVDIFINPNSTLKEMGITEDKYKTLAEHIFKVFYCGDKKELLKYDPDLTFKQVVKDVINNLKELPKEEAKVSGSTEGILDNFSKMFNIGSKHATWSSQTMSQGDSNQYYLIDNFPYWLFVRRANQLYKTNRLEHLIHRVGNRAIRIHKFFVPELLYIMDQLQFPKSLIESIRLKTWMGKTVLGTTKLDTSRIEKNMNCKLYPHQHEFIVNYNLKKDQCNLHGYLLSFEQGLGKTITALALMEALGKEKVVIFCPKNTMQETWLHHINTFYKTPQKVYMAYGPEPDPDTRFFILNYEAISKCNPEWFTGKNLSSIGVIVDESHNFLRMASDRTENLIRFVNTLPPSADILPMSGTPIKCAGVEMIPMLYLLDPYFDRDAYETFKAAFGFNMKIATDVLHHRLEMMMARVTKEILNLPKKNETTIAVKMPTSGQYTARSVKLAIQDFINERKEVHRSMMSKYNKDFDDAVNYLLTLQESNTAEFTEWKNVIDTLRSGANFRDFGKGVIARINEYENEVLVNLLPMDLRKRFKAARAAVKYLFLKIRGEVLGGLLTNLRMKMTSEMMEAVNLESIVEDSVKKTVIFTSYVDTIDLANSYFLRRDYNPVVVYGDTANQLTANINAFQTSPGLNPMIASLKMLATGATLTAANTVIFLNKPWRSIEYDQASDRVHRIGQDTDVNVVSLVLDTGDEPNLSTRMEEIMNYSSELFDGIVEGTPVSNEIFNLLPQDTQELLEYATEKLFISDKGLFDAVKSAREVSTKEQLLKELKPGDLLVVYRSVKNPDYLVDSIFSPLAKRIQGSSFTSIKMVGPNGSVYGFGVKIHGKEFSRMSLVNFIKTCPGVLVLRRPDPIPEDQLNALWDWFNERTEKIKYSVGKMWKSLVTHLGIGNKDTTTQEEAQKYMKPMFCSTVFAYGFKAVGINDGITINRDTVWPKDFVLNSAFKPIIRYFKKDEDADAVLVKPEDMKVSGECFQTTEGLVDEYGDLVTDSEEKLVINHKEFVRVIQQAKECRNHAAFMAECQPGDLILTYRKQKTNFAKTFAMVNNWIAKSSFASIKMVDEDPKYVIGFAARQNTEGFNRAKLSGFLRTVNGVILLRLPGGIPADKREEYFKYLHNKINNVEYSPAQIAKSIFTHLFGMNKGDTSTVSEAYSKKAMFCSSIFAYANKACGINDGLTVNRKDVWPIDFAVNSSYKPVARYLIERKEFEEIVNKSNEELTPEELSLKEEVLNGYSNEIFGCDIDELSPEEYDLMTMSEEKLFIKNQELFNALKGAQSLSDRKELASKLQPGDLLLVYRSYTTDLLDAAVTGINRMIQRASFTSLKIVYKDPKYVVGFGTRMKGSGFSKTNTDGFLETCNGVCVLRLPGGIPADKADKLWEWIDDRIGRIDYYTVGLIKSIINHLNPWGKDKKTTTDEAKGQKSHMFCSTVFAYAFKAAGISDGLSVGRDGVWPTEWATKSKMKCVYRYFAPGEGADKIFNEAPKQAEGGDDEDRKSIESLDPFHPSNENMSRLIALEDEQATSTLSILKDLDTPDNNAVASTEAMTDQVILKKKEAILKKICKCCDIIDPSGTNSDRYRKLFASMNAKKFDEFMTAIRDGKWQLDVIVPNFIINVTNENLIKAADEIGCKLMHKVWMRDAATGRKYLTDNEYLVITLPVRRQQQFLDEKISVPDNDEKIDGLSGQVTGDDESCSITNPEIQILAARGLDRTLQELVNIRGGNIHGYNEFKRALEETGDASLDQIDPNTKPRISVVAEVLLKGMMIDNNISK